MVVVAVELMGAAPPVEETHAVADSADNGTGISWERSVRLELCILTANERDDKSAGNGVSSDRRVMVNEHNLANGMSQITIKHEHYAKAYTVDIWSIGTCTICYTRIQTTYVDVGQIIY